MSTRLPLPLLSRRLAGLALLFCCCFASEGSHAPFAPSASAVQGPTPSDFKIAFLADQGLGGEAVAVLTLVRNEGAHAIVHPGDLDYDDKPEEWDAQLTGVLGRDFPYFAVMGNHDEDLWPGPQGYQQILKNRMGRVGLSWEGDFGVRSSFHHKGIFFVMAAPGMKSIRQRDWHVYLRERLAADRSIWSIAIWHKNMRAMQVGGKDNDTGWEVYEAAREGGAIIATAHEHSYSRTHLLSHMASQTVASTSSTLTIRKGQTFAFVSGLGGRSIRDQERSGPWWARIYASACLPRDPVCEPNAAPGALFGVFNAGGIPNRAEFYFKDVNGRVVDRFTVISDVEPLTTTSSQQ
jgi:hypothetical protein